jgi:hypothetical protein
MGDVESAKQDLSGLEIQRSQLREKEMSLDGRLNRLHAESKVQTELDMLRRDRAGRAEQVRKLRAAIKEEMQELLGAEAVEAAEDGRLREVYEEAVRRVQAELGGLEARSREAEKRHTGNELRRKMMQEEVRGKEAQMRKCEVSGCNVYLAA